MEIITKKRLLKELPKTWRLYYDINIVWANGNSSFEIPKLLEKEVDLTEDRAAEIIGNRSWTRNECDECGQDCDIVVRLGQEPDYESSTAQICLACLQVAIQLIEVEQRNV